MEVKEVERNEEKKVEKNKHISNSFKYAFQGIISSFYSERNMKIHIVAIILVVILGIFLKIDEYEWIICIILFGVVVAGELFNTAIETAVDLAMPEINEKAKLAKDISAGAVLVIAIGAAISGLIIFIPKILEIIKI